MRILLTDRASAAIADAPPAVRKAFAKQLAFLERDLYHPSLRAKKYDATHGVWQARVDRNWRFYFTIAGEVYAIHDVIPHPK